MLKFKGGGGFTLYYEVDKKLEEYLCTERSDAFVVGLVLYAMSRSNNEDPITITCYAPLSNRLYYQLVVHLIPAISKELKFYNTININCGLDDRIINSQNAVATGVSGGVDSFYTLLKNKEENISGHKITHGVYLEYDTKASLDDELPLKLREYAENICNELGIVFVSISSNIVKDVYRLAHEAIITPMFTSYIFALQKLFSIYYFSSGHPYSSFKICSHSSELYNLLYMHLLSSENLSFYTTGSDALRHEKTLYISNFELPRHYLNVCRNPYIEKGVLKNCSKCSKCTRTMIDLYVYGKLDLFRDIFDVDAFNRNKDYYLGYLVFKGKKDHYVAETLEAFRKKKIKFPISARFAGLMKLFKNGFNRGNPLQFTYKP